MQTSETLSYEMTKSIFIYVIKPRSGQGLHLVVLTWQERLLKELRLQAKWPLALLFQNHSQFTQHFLTTYPDPLLKGLPLSPTSSQVFFLTTPASTEVSKLPGSLAMALTITTPCINRYIPTVQS